MIWFTFSVEVSSRSVVSSPVREECRPARVLGDRDAFPSLKGTVTVSNVEKYLPQATGSYRKMKRNHKKEWNREAYIKHEVERSSLS